jgi:hypothetical protein
MDERRDVARTRIRHNAEIMVGGHSVTTLPCTLQDLTSTGACLLLASTDGLPDTFELTFDHGRSRRPCWVRWRAQDRLGVSFEKAGDDAKTAGVES